jgi:hypothetical protein
MASIQLEEVKVAIAALQEKINEAEGKLVKSEERLESATTELDIQKFKVLVESASANLTSLQEKKLELLNREIELIRSLYSDNKNQDLEELIFKGMKRVLEDTENSSSSSKRTYPARPGQVAFVERLAERDGRCPIMNTPKDACVGAHIIGFDFWFENPEIWEEQYKELCFEWTHNVDDVRNGILMDPRLHQYFDNYFFTIYRNDDQFKIKMGENFYPRDAQFANLDGQILSFGPRSNLWPHAEFLKFHNRKFAFKQRKAAAEAKAFHREKSEGTILKNLESIDDFKKKWLLEQQELYAAKNSY